MNQILFADDDAAMRQMVSDMLRSASHEVRLARNGWEALQEVYRSPPDLVLLDYRMGIPDGLQVCRELKTDPRFGHLPVLILTGEGEIEDRLMGFDAGADDYLAKPFDARELLARVGALLRLARRGLDRNPTSRLPGGEAIVLEFDRRQKLGAPFSVCYLDLNDFKPFNDRFGFAVADAVIRDAGEVLRSVTAGTEAFAGHVGGDDFILLASSEHARQLAETAQQTFRTRLEQRLPPDVFRADQYEGIDRNGTMRVFRVTRFTAAIVRLPQGSDVPLSVIGEVVAEAKDRAKRPGGTGVEEIDYPG